MVDSPHADQFARQQMSELRVLVEKTATTLGAHVDQCEERERRTDERFAQMSQQFQQHTVRTEEQVREIKHGVNGFRTTAEAALRLMDDKLGVARKENDDGRKELREEVKGLLETTAKRTAEVLVETEKRAGVQRDYLLERINDLKKTVAWVGILITTTGVASLAYFLTKFGLPGGGH